MTLFDVPTREEKDWLLDEMAKLIPVCGADRFVSAPLLFPDENCFPDDITADMEGVRLLILRLLAYAGLPDLNVSVTHYTDPDLRPENLGPHVVDAESSGKGIAAFFAGIFNGFCMFGVEESEITNPEALLGVLAHEVAHAWRRVKGIETSDPDAEEYLTDLTTIYLGYGVLSTNASYRYETEGDYNRLVWSHSGRGYLPCEAMAYLLAAHCRARLDDHRDIAKHLDVTQKVFFEDACEDLDPDELITRLGLPPADDWPAIQPPNPQALNHALSENQELIEKMVQQYLPEPTKDATFLPAPRVCDFSPDHARHQVVMTWGRIDGDNPIESSLLLVEVQSGPHQLLVLEVLRKDEQTDLLLGMIHDEVGKKRKLLRPALAKLCDTNGLADAPLLAGLPTYIHYPSGTPLKLDDMEDLLFRAAGALDPPDLESSIGVLEEYAGDPWARMAAGESTGTQMSGISDAGEVQVSISDRERTRLLKRWWEVVTDPECVEFEMKAFGEAVEQYIEGIEDEE